MFKDGCIHPGIMQALSRCGHGDKILIADGNYPLQGRTGACERVYLGVRAGLPQVTAGRPAQGDQRRGGAGHAAR